MSMKKKAVLCEAVITVITLHYGDDDPKQHHLYPITDSYQVEFEGRDSEDFIAYLLNYPKAINTSRLTPQ